MTILYRVIVGGHVSFNAILRAGRFTMLKDFTLKKVDVILKEVASTQKIFSSSSDALHGFLSRPTPLLENLDDIWVDLERRASEFPEVLLSSVDIRDTVGEERIKSIIFAACERETRWLAQLMMVLRNPPFHVYACTHNSQLLAFATIDGYSERRGTRLLQLYAVVIHELLSRCRKLEKQFEALFV